MKHIIKKWVNFFESIVDPWVLVTIFLTIFLSISINSTTDKSIIVLLTVLISLSSASAGSIIAKNIIELKGEDLIKARGKVSIRSLKLILGNLHSFSKRIESQINGNENEIEKYKNRDILERLTILEEEVLSSIENWNDIIPEADVSSQIGIISSLRMELQNKEKEKKAIINSLSSETEKTIEEKNQLACRLENLEQELAESKKLLYEKSLDLYGSTASIIESSNLLDIHSILDIESLLESDKDLKNIKSSNEKD